MSSFLALSSRNSRAVFGWQVSLLFGQIGASLWFASRQVGFILSFKFSGSTPYVVHGRIPSVIEEDASFDKAFSGSRRCSNSSHLCARFNATWSLPSVSEANGIISVKRCIFLSNLVLRVSHADHGLAKLVKMQDTSKRKKERNERSRRKDKTMKTPHLKPTDHITCAIWFSFSSSARMRSTHLSCDAMLAKTLSVTVMSVRAAQTPRKIPCWLMCDLQNGHSLLVGRQVRAIRYPTQRPPSLFHLFLLIGNHQNFEFSHLFFFHFKTWPGCGFTN